MFDLKVIHLCFSIKIAIDFDALDKAKENLLKEIKQELKERPHFK